MHFSLENFLRHFFFLTLILTFMHIYRHEQN